MSAMALPVTPELVGDAAARLRGRVVATPCVESRTLSAMTGSRVLCKYENLQFTGSFKDRGAANRLLTLDDAQRQAGQGTVGAHTDRVEAELTADGYTNRREPL
jgi:threonine dehydratase